jgi:hypothetical protein
MLVPDKGNQLAIVKKNVPQRASASAWGVRSVTLSLTLASTRSA